MLRLFRRLRKDEQSAEQPAPVPVQELVQEAEPVRRRSRGSRGGRGRKRKPAAVATAASAAEPSTALAEVEEPPQGLERAGGSSKRRRRPTARRPAIQAVKKEIVISVEVGEQCVAVIEDGKPAEVYLERRGRRSIAGNIYKGVIDNVLPGMEASFVDIGLEKNGFLYVDEIVVPELEGKRHGKRIQELVERGQSVLVQAVKDPMGTKGARLTTEISLPGRFLVYVPQGEGIGVSRRLEEPERERLKAICKELELPEGGIIVRTAAEGASQEEVEGDLRLLRKLWSTIKSRAERAEAPSLVYQEAELPLRIIRDLFIRDFERVTVDHEGTYALIVGYLRRTSPPLAARVELYSAPEPLLEQSGVHEAIRSTLNRRVDLPSGGYLIFDYAEAFTVIDVNTGRFVGSRGKTSTARLEDTITKNNLEAAAEVVRQLRLRDIGGIIVIDFIDMANPKNRLTVEEALRQELERDRTKTYVVEISPLGLVEMTRQNVTDGPREILTVKCDKCSGDGILVSNETVAIEIERKLRRTIAAASSEAFLVQLNPHIAGILIGPGGARLDELEKETGRRFAFRSKPRAALSHFVVLAEGPASEIDPQAFPVSPGEELELTIENVHLQNEENGIARLDGYVISVGGGADFVGRQVKVRIERAGRTAAYAIMPDAPPRRRSVVEIATEAAAAAVSEAPELAEVAAEVASDVAPDVAAEGAVPRKRRTRRGTRGGRGRKRKTAAGDVGTEEAEEQTEAGQDGLQEAVAENGTAVQEPAAQAGIEPVKKRTRRGTRGGRGRKKAPLAEGAAPAETVEEAEGEALPEDLVETAVELAADGKEPAPKRARSTTAATAARSRSRKKTPDAQEEIPEAQAASAGSSEQAEPAAVAADEEPG